MHGSAIDLDGRSARPLRVRPAASPPSAGEAAAIAELVKRLAPLFTSLTSTPTETPNANAHFPP